MEEDKNVKELPGVDSQKEEQPKAKPEEQTTQKVFTDTTTVKAVNEPRHIHINWALIGKVLTAAIFCFACGFGGGALANYMGVGEKETTVDNSAAQFFGALPFGDGSYSYSLPDSGSSEEETPSESSAVLGITVQQVTESEEQEAGVYVVAISVGSKAQEAGLKIGDRIIKADDTDVSTNQDLSGVIAKKEAGDTVTITAVRDGEEFTADVELVSRNSLTTDENRAA